METVNYWRLRECTQKGNKEDKQHTYQAGLSARGRPCPQVRGAYKRKQGFKNPSQTTVPSLPSLGKTS